MLSLGKRLRKGTASAQSPTQCGIGKPCSVCSGAAGREEGRSTSFLGGGDDAGSQERVRGNPIVNEEKREHREPPSNLGEREERAGLRERRKSIPSWELEEGRREWKGQL